GADALGAEQVLVTDRCTQQGAALAVGAAHVSGFGLGDGLLFGDSNKAVQLWVELLDARQQRTGQLLGGELLVAKRAGDLGEGQLMHVGVLHYSITRGTRYRPSSTAGAMA